MFKESYCFNCIFDIYFLSIIIGLTFQISIVLRLMLLVSKVAVFPRMSNAAHQLYVAVMRARTHAKNYAHCFTLYVTIWCQMI